MVTVNRPVFISVIELLQILREHLVTVMPDILREPFAMSLTILPWERYR